MGADGGSIPRREELVQLKKKEEKADQNELERIKWFLCAISKEPLTMPVVTCELGFLYNKEVVIKRLIDKSMPEAFSHIRSLKDIFPVNFQPNPEYNPNGEKKSASVADIAQDSPFMCPLSGLLVGSNHKFSMLRTCGCAFSERALRECHSDVCLTCNTPFTAQDVLPLNPDEEELKVLKQKLKEKRANEKKEKKEKKSKKNSKSSSTTSTEMSSKRKIEEVEPSTKSVSSTVTTTTSTTSVGADSKKQKVSSSDSSFVKSEKKGSKPISATV